jgi:hypothetical protein
MAVTLLDLQLIYGVAGARQKFEKLVKLLLKEENDGAKGFEAVPGDDGIDLYVGDLTSGEGVHVFQCKFFPQGLGLAQKGQVRESFKRCIQRNKVTRWTLCLPVDLTKPQMVWFENWKATQAGTGVTIDEVWGADKLEGLLFQEKNQGLKEAFFKE